MKQLISSAVLGDALFHLKHHCNSEITQTTEDKVCTSNRVPVPLEGVDVFVIGEGIRSSLTVLLCITGADAVSFVDEGEPLWPIGVLVGVTEVLALGESP